MKITLDASIKEHREIAELFRGCEEFITGQTFIAMVEYLEGEYMFMSDNTQLFDKITIDLDQAQMDLRMAIGTGIEFRLPHYTPNRILRTANFSEGVNVFNFNQFFGIDADKIKLCLDYLISVGVEVEE